RRHPHHPGHFGRLPRALFALEDLGELGRLRAPDPTLEEEPIGSSRQGIPWPAPTQTPDGDFLVAPPDKTPPCFPAPQALNTLRLRQAIACSLSRDPSGRPAPRKDPSAPERRRGHPRRSSPSTRRSIDGGTPGRPLARPGAPRGRIFPESLSRSPGALA